MGCMVTDGAQPIEPDTKDWTWVLEEACGECGFDAAGVGVPDVAAEVRRNARLWPVVLEAPTARSRPQPDVWSPTEYGAHVRDVHLLFADRVRLMLDEDAPTFANWDQDVTAVEAAYAEADPDVVAAGLMAAAEDVADLYDAVPESSLGRPGHRSNGSTFTVLTLARYHLHDVVHHLWDVRHASS